MYYSGNYSGSFYRHFYHTSLHYMIVYMLLPPPVMAVGKILLSSHNKDVIMGWRLKWPALLRLFTQSFIEARIKENFKAPRHWPLCGELTGDRWIFPTQKDSSAENVSTWWRHHVDGLRTAWVSIRLNGQRCSVACAWLNHCGRE